MKEKDSLLFKRSDKNLYSESLGLRLKLMAKKKIAIYVGSQNVWELWKLLLS